MEGELWIDKKTFQWIKVEATVIHPVSIAGFLAEVEPGTHFELEKMALEENLWLPKHFAMKSRAKIFACSLGSRKRMKLIPAITKLRRFKPPPLRSDP